MSTDLCEALEQRMVLLVGEPGVGKTCVLRVLRCRLPQTGFRLTFCHKATRERRDFDRPLCLALGLAASAITSGVLHAVSSHAETHHRERTQPVVLLDEADLLHQDTLDPLHVLFGDERDSLALPSPLRVGLTELEERLEPRMNRSLHPRIHCRLSIDPRAADDTTDDVRLRLRRAAGDRDLFAADAVGLLQPLASASLHEVDRLATAALRQATRRKKKRVERDVLARTPSDGSAPASDA